MKNREDLKTNNTNIFPINLENDSGRSHKGSQGKSKLNFKELKHFISSSLTKKNLTRLPQYLKSHYLIIKKLMGPDIRLKKSKILFV